MIALLLVLAGCGVDPCELMCDEAAVRYEACLSAEGLDWEAAGYTDGDDFIDSCDTWAWEQRLLARDAGEPPRRVSATCEESREVAVTGDCAAFYALVW